MSEIILCVDDEAEMRTVYSRSLEGMFTVETMASGSEALQRLAHGPPVAVLVSDLNMPGMDGIQLLTKVKELFPDTMRLLLTGETGFNYALQAVNDGSVFRFLTKPTSVALLRSSVAAALEQRRLILAERELLEQTLRGIINTFSEILALANPAAFGKSLRIRQWVREMSSLEGNQTDWSVDIAASLSQVGCISVSERTLVAAEHGKTLTHEEQAALRKHPALGADLLRKIPRLEIVAEMVSLQQSAFDPTQEVSPASAGGQLLRVATDFDQLLQSGRSREQALVEMAKRVAQYNPTTFGKLELAVRGKVVLERTEVSVTRLEVGMVLAEDVVASNGVMLLREGFEITEVARVRLRLSSESGLIRDHVTVSLPASGGALH